MGESEQLQNKIENKKLHYTWSWFIKRWTKSQTNQQSQGEPVAANLQINGHFDRTLEQWKGTLSQAKFDTLIGDVKSNQAIAVSYDNKQTQANIAAHCSQNTDVELCFHQTFNEGKQGDIHFQFKRVKLDLSNKLIEQDSSQRKLASAR